MHPEILGADVCSDLKIPIPGVLNGHVGIVGRQEVSIACDPVTASVHDVVIVSNQSVRFFETRSAAAIDALGPGVVIDVITRSNITVAYLITGAVKRPSIEHPADVLAIATIGSTGFTRWFRAGETAWAVDVVPGGGIGVPCTYVQSVHSTRPLCFPRDSTLSIQMIVYTRPCLQYTDVTIIRIRKSDGSVRVAIDNGVCRYDKLPRIFADRISAAPDVLRIEVYVGDPVGLDDAVIPLNGLDIQTHCRVISRRTVHRIDIVVSISLGSGRN